MDSSHLARIRDLMESRNKNSKSLAGCWVAGWMHVGAVEGEGGRAGRTEQSRPGQNRAVGTAKFCSGFCLG